MTKKNLKPQQAAPVQREINTTSSVGGTGLTPQNIAYSIIGAILGHKTPFSSGLSVTWHGREVKRDLDFLG
ncbi:DUF5840 family protein [Planktothrix agardhii 1806]|jgi:prenylated cyclic peptide (anacyclamide/piricyclamide family)|uniref:anacyclamide/piricyclamide family prenylated cyclic peptide n=1 Tax=Planktothrix agardhii TaxID=1160 RepID=UPI000DBB3196|nr:anacyclamide/piricyclamide family prenylated cyclic peptide [Planktothrix agardhii]MCF3572002.1 DUF5840 family protein [Planktothrix agardhii 1805]MCF3601788.1 DUF5840 family protein [Planktothrix agardhii 1804]MCF3617303.1 DUF5840 family protein [Planktothrix agardhii 1806]BBD55888.1 hypothetical protein NIES204_32070 [Planktothrix agardhii NIES-204]